MKLNLKEIPKFTNRHLGPNQEEMDIMLRTIGVESLHELIKQTVPNNILIESPLNLPIEKSEKDFLTQFKELISKNKIFKNYIGLGYYNSFTPGVIQRNILENPGWYTAYTPYQAEIAQGRLEALINFQTMVIDLTGMEIANASLLDEATAAAEAMSMLFSVKKGNKRQSHKFLVDKNIFPQTLAVLKTRAMPLGIELVIKDVSEFDLTDPGIYGMMLSYPDGDGAVKDFNAMMETAKAQNIFVSFCADLLSLTLLTPPGEMGADIVVGSTQRFGIPLGYGGPHAAYFATREAFKRQIPGRIIGVSVDVDGNQGYRMALQTREQHIRREKATSNICTAQVLLAVMAGMYAVYHGPEGLRNMALRVHGLTLKLAQALQQIGYRQLNDYFFDTIKIDTDKGLQDQIKRIATKSKVNFRYYQDGATGIALDETTSWDDIESILMIFTEAGGKEKVNLSQLGDEISLSSLRIPASIRRESSFLNHPIFTSMHSEHQLLRYIKKLENKDLSLVHSMIALGSCTMKLNATTEMIPLSWDSIGQLHPFAPVDQTQGYHEMFTHLEKWLNAITGFEGTSLQPNSGAQGEFSGLMVIKAYLEDKGEHHRNVTLIPSSAHGTNPASAVMAGMKVVIVKCDEHGNIDLEDLKAKADQYQESLAALMVTYPSTHGVFEEDILEICDTIHQKGGQVYMDGANMNAQVGITSPARIGADVCHINLHKTFCIPHGGGGPGMGPISVAEHLKPFLPSNPVQPIGGASAIPAISAAPWGSASILAISYAYISMMGGAGLKMATQVAILSANYIKEKLKDHYKILYTGRNGRSAHEMIIDCREFKKFNVEVEDIAKRLMDYGFHAPTVSFPVPGTMMIEPTESESLDELDRFIEALISIRQEIQEIEDQLVPAEDNVLKNAPHTAQLVMSDRWDFPYSRDKAAFPLEWLRVNKFWPSIRRLDSAYGDRNLMCSCIPVEQYENEEELV